jgi:hypothetical protein
MAKENTNGGNMKAIHRTIAENLRASFAKRKMEFSIIPAAEKLDRAFVNGCISESMHLIDSLAAAISNLDSSFDRELFSAIAYGNDDLVAKLTKGNRNR